MRKLGPLFDPNANGATPTGDAGGDLEGTYPNPAVKQLTGVAGVVAVIATLVKVLLANVIYSLFELTLPTGRRFKLTAITNTPPDDQVAIGYSPKENISYSAVTFEGEFDSFGNGGKCFETYLEDAGPAAAGIMRGWFTAFLYDKNGGAGTVGDAVTVIESGNGKGVSFQDIVGGVGTAFFGGTPASLELLSTTINVGNPSGASSAVNLWGSFIQFFPGGVLAAQHYFAAPTFYTCDYAAPITGLRANGAGQQIFIQSATGKVSLVSAACQLTDSTGLLIRVSAGDAGLGLNGHAQAAQPADVGAMNYTGGGAISGTRTVKAVTNNADSNDNFATVCAQLDAIRTALRTQGVMA